MQGGAQKLMHGVTSKNCFAVLCANREENNNRRVAPFINRLVCRTSASDLVHTWRDDLCVVLCPSLDRLARRPRRGRRAAASVPTAHSPGSGCPARARDRIPEPGCCALGAHSGQVRSVPLQEDRPGVTVEQPSGSSSRTPGCSMSTTVLRGTSPGRRSPAIGCRRACMSRRSACAGGSRSTGCRTLRRTG